MPYAILGADSTEENGTDGASDEAGAVNEGAAVVDPRNMSDEEKKKRGDMLRNAPAVDVAVNQITATKEKSARKVAEEWWDNNVSEPQTYETEAGEVEINRNSVESSLAHRYGQAKLDAITSLVEGFENAVYLGTMPDSTRQEGVVNHYFPYPINYNGKRCYVFCRALHDNNTNRLYVHEVFIEENIKKGNTLQTAASQPHGGVALYRDILANVLDFSDGKVTNNSANVQENEQENAPDTIKNAEQETNTNPTEAQKITHDEAMNLIAEMENRAEIAPDVALTIENWDKLFADGKVNTPIGEVKMGENQFTKLTRQGREGKLGMVKPTLENPDVIIEDASEAKEGDVTERGSSYVFVKAFKKADGSRYYYFTSVTVSKDGKEVVISNQEKRKNAIANLLSNGKLVWKHADDVSAVSDVEQGLYSSQGNMSDPTTEGTDAPQTNVSSASKVTNNSANVQENEQENVPETIKNAEQETNTNPTEAQKEAGNYKKGHVRIDGFDVTIENPKGSVRRGTDVSGKQWEQEMQNTYGYIRGTEGVDGDHIDVFLSDDPSQGNVFVIDQINEDGSFDEHKVMYGFSDIESARKAYLSNYEEGWQGLGAITPVSKEEFKKWINSSHRKTKPFAEYSSVKPLEENKKVTEESLKQFLGDWEKDPENATKTVDKKGQPIVVYRGGGRLDNIEDDHNNTLYIELSTDNSYWSVNSGGVFRRNYGNNKEEVWSASEEQNKQSATDNTLQATDKSDNPVTSNGNVSNTSASKVTNNSANVQEKEQENAISGLKGYSEEE